VSSEHPRSLCPRAHASVEKQVFEQYSSVNWSKTCANALRLAGTSLALCSECPQLSLQGTVIGGWRVHICAPTRYALLLHDCVRPSVRPSVRPPGSRPQACRLCPSTSPPPLHLLSNSSPSPFHLLYITHARSRPHQPRQERPDLEPILLRPRRRRPRRRAAAGAADARAPRRRAAFRRRAAPRRTRPAVVLTGGGGAGGGLGRGVLCIGPAGQGLHHLPGRRRRRRRSEARRVFQIVK
jgi:hypothetical protein